MKKVFKKLTNLFFYIILGIQFLLFNKLTMTIINQREAMKAELDLSDWWEMVNDSNEAQYRILRWEKWPFYWFDDNEKWIITLKDGRFIPYEVSKTKIILPLEAGDMHKKIRKAVLNTLKKNKIKLNYNCKVKNSAEAFKRAEREKNKVFRFISDDKTTIRVLDFTEWKIPRIIDYPTKETEIIYDAIEM